MRASHVYLAVVAVVAVIVIGGGVLGDSFEVEQNDFTQPANPEGPFAEPCAALEGSSLVEGATTLATPAPNLAECVYQGLPNREVRVGLISPVTGDLTENPGCSPVQVNSANTTACSLSHSIQGNAVAGTTVLVVSGSTSAMLDVTGAPLTEAEINDSAQRLAAFVSG